MSTIQHIFQIDHLINVNFLNNTYTIFFIRLVITYMIRIKITGPCYIEETVNTIQVQYPLDRKHIWIGRGEEHEKEDCFNYFINLARLSQTISRVHACIILSPAFFYQSSFHYPGYYDKFGQKWKQLPSNILNTIWKFVQPQKKILLKDMQSRSGIYQKIVQCSFQANMKMVLGDSKPLIFHNQQIYDRTESMNCRVQQLSQQNYTILNNYLQGNQAKSFWILSYKQHYYVLLNQPSKLFIGRSTDCDIVIPLSSVSKKHASLQFIIDRWIIKDGNGVSRSVNGLWKRTQKIWIDYRDNNMSMSGGQNIVKIGDIKFQFCIVEQYSRLNVSQMCRSKDSINESSFNTLLTKQLLTEQHLSNLQGLNN